MEKSTLLVKIVLYHPCKVVSSTENVLIEEVHIIHIFFILRIYLESPSTFTRLRLQLRRGSLPPSLKLWRTMSCYFSLYMILLKGWRQPVEALAKTGSPL